MQEMRQGTDLQNGYDEFRLFNETGSDRQEVTDSR